MRACDEFEQILKVLNRSISDKTLKHLKNPFTICIFRVVNVETVCYWLLCHLAFVDEALFKELLVLLHFLQKAKSRKALSELVQNGLPLDKYVMDH